MGDSWNQSEKNSSGRQHHETTSFLRSWVMPYKMLSPLLLLCRRQISMNLVCDVEFKAFVNAIQDLLEKSVLAL